MEQFEQVFRNEMFYPDLLPFDEELFDSLSDKLFYLKRSLEEIEQNTHLDGSSLLIPIYKTNVQRLNYLLTSYLRIRQSKIQRFYFYIQQNLPKYETRLAEGERQFLDAYYQNCNKLIVRTGEFEEFVAKKQKLFEYPIEPVNAGAFFLKSNQEANQLSIVKSIDIEQIALITRKEASLV